MTSVFVPAQIRDALHAQAMEQNVERLMSAECDPFTPNNFSEAVGELNDATMTKLATLFIRGDFAAAGKLMNDLVTEYWREIAEGRAYRIQPDCSICGDIGCQNCDGEF